MTSGEAAVNLEVSRQHIHHLVQVGKLKAQRAGDFWLFERSELDRYRETPKGKGGRPKEAAGALGVLLFPALMISIQLG